MTNEKLIIPIKYHADIEPIESITIGDWIDLRAAEDVFIKTYDTELISLGISMKLPEGYEAHILPRSSTFKNWGIILTNSMGIIDNSYSGTNDIWKFSAYCLKGGIHKTKDGVKLGTYINKGDRICQFRIVKKQPDIEFQTVEFLDESDRGGFGRTGTN